MSYGLSPAAVRTVFPFHFVVDAQFVVRQVGSALTLLAPSLTVGDPMAMHFTIERPRGAHPPVGGQGRLDVLYILRCVHGGARLRGEWVPLDDGAVMFVGAPWVVEMSALAEAGLTLRDFARHDGVSDYLVLLKTMQMSLVDSEQLQQKLREHKASLQQLVDARTEALTREMDKVARSERALAHQTQLLQGIFDGIPVMIAVLDGQGRPQLVNREVERVLGFGVDLWATPQVQAQLLPDEAERARFLALTHEAPQPWQELPMTPRQGQPLLVSWCSVRVDDGIICIGQDVTQRKQAERLAQQLERTEHLAGIGQLAAGIAHEVNNPASYVLANLELMQDDLVMVDRFIARVRHDLPGGDRGAAAARADAVRQQLQELSEMTRESLDGMFRIRKIVRDLSTFSRAQSQEVEWVSIDDVIDAAARLAAHEIRHRAHLVKACVPTPKIAADRGKLVQLLVNLLVNAAHAIEGGDAAHNRVTVSTAVEDASIWLKVRDTGRGMEPDVVERVFEPFFTTKEPGVGTGLGLSLCAEIARMHGGALRVESTPGQGTEVTLALPKDTGLQPASVSGPGLDRRVEPSSVAARGRGARVLLVDDEPSIRGAYRRVLEPEHQVTLASSGREAQELLLGAAGDPFDVILCDLMMPDVDGPMLYERVREQAPHLLSRFVFLSGGVSTSRARQMVSTIPNIVLEKPVERHVLRGVVAELSGD